MTLDGVPNITSRHWNDDAGRGREKIMFIHHLYKHRLPNPVGPRQVDETISLRGQLAGVCGILWVIGQPRLCKRDDIKITFTYIMGDEIRLISDGSCIK